MRISRAHWDELVAHAREEVPNECCGYARVKDGSVEEVFRAVNERHSPYGFSFGFEALSAANQLEDDGFQVAVYHSHPRSSAEPSQQDRNEANYPSWTYLIVSLADDEPQVRAWRIEDGRVSEEQLELVE